MLCNRHLYCNRKYYHSDIMHPYQVRKGKEDVYCCVLAPCHKWTCLRTHAHGAGTAPYIIGHYLVHEIFKGKFSSKWQWFMNNTKPKQNPLPLPTHVKSRPVYLLCFVLHQTRDNRDADKSLARPTSRCILFDSENISFVLVLLYIWIVLIFLQLWL